MRFNAMQAILLDIILMYAPDLSRRRLLRYTRVPYGCKVSSSKRKTCSMHSCWTVCSTCPARCLHWYNVQHNQTTCERVRLMLRSLPGVFGNVLGTPSSGFGLTLFINVYNAIFWYAPVVLGARPYPLMSAFVIFSGLTVRLLQQSDPLTSSARQVSMPISCLHRVQVVRLLCSCLICELPVRQFTLSREIGPAQVRARMLDLRHGILHPGPRATAAARWRCGRPADQVKAQCGRQRREVLPGRRFIWLGGFYLLRRKLPGLTLCGQRCYSEFFCFLSRCRH